MPNNALKTISEPQALFSSKVVRYWLVIFGEIFAREITTELVEAWCGLLANVEPTLLAKACEMAARTCRFFPTPGDVLGLVDQADAGGFALEAEQKWSAVLEYARRYYFPDTGVARDAPALHPAVEFAVRAAGGLRWLESCPESELQWARKRFIEAYRTLHETQQTEHLLTRVEAKRILARLAAGAPESERRQIGPTPEIPAAKPRPQESRAVLRDVAKLREEAPPELTSEELEVRRQDQKQRLAIWMAEHP